MCHINGQMLYCFLITAAFACGCSRAGGALGHVPRYLFILGQLCRYGSHTLDAVAAEEAAGHAQGAPALPPNKQTPDCRRCLELFVRVWGCPMARGVQERALEVRARASGHTWHLGIVSGTRGDDYFMVVACPCPHNYCMCLFPPCQYRRHVSVLCCIRLLTNCVLPLPQQISNLTAIMCMFRQPASPCILSSSWCMQAHR